MAFVEPDGEPRIMNNAEGHPTTPSVVAWRETKDGGLDLLVGKFAKTQAVLNPEGTVSSIRRKMGTAEKVRIHDEEYTPEEISARILKKLKEDAELFFREEITNAVISVPAYFRDGERKATTNAAVIAGWDEDKIGIFNEPNCAAMAYALDRHLMEGKILVFDLGGGAFDVTVLEAKEGVLSVKTNGGERLLGGDDFDRRIISYVVEEFQKENDIDLRANKDAMLGITDAAENAKNELSTEALNSTSIVIPFIVPERSLNLDMELTRAKFDELTEDLVQKTVEITKKTLQDAGIRRNEIDKVVMVGGCSRILAVQDAVRRMFPGREIALYDPDLAIAKGAAIYAAILFEPETPEDIELRKRLVARTEIPKVLASHSLGVDALVKGAPGVFAIIIKKDTPLPASSTEIYATSEDNQTSLSIKLYEGEKTKAAENCFLGELIVEDIPPRAKGVEKIEVTFEYAVDNTLDVTVKVVSTGKELQSRIKSPSELEPAQMEQMALKAKYDPDLAIAEGTAIYAARFFEPKTPEDIELLRDQKKRREEMDKPIEKTILEQVKRLEKRSGELELKERSDKSAVSVRESQSAVLLLFDATGSMGSLWEETGKIIKKMVERITEHGSVKLKCCAYRDYCDGDLLFESSGWYSKPEPLLNFIRNIKIESGMGGDEPEAVEYALQQAASEQEVSRVILIADAPPRKEAYKQCYELATDLGIKGRPIYAFRTPPTGIPDHFWSETKKVFSEIAKTSGGRFADIDPGNPGELLDMLAVTVWHDLDPEALPDYDAKYHPSKKVKEFIQSLPPAPKK